MNAKELREEFIRIYDGHPPMRRTVRGRVLPQNDQHADVRATWVEFVDHMRREGKVANRVAQNAVL